MLKIKSFEFNPIAVNTYVVWDDESLESVVIDAGCYTPDENERLRQFIASENLTVKQIWATHLHFDHILGNAFATETFGAGLAAHRDDEFLLKNFKRQTEIFGLVSNGETVPIARYVDEGDILSVGRYGFTALHVPGHSPGSLVYYCAKAGVAFAGDVIFRDSIGRTDLWGGNYEQLIEGIETKLLTLPDTTVVYTGHGGATNIGYEKTHNPYLQ